MYVCMYDVILYDMTARDGYNSRVSPPELYPADLSYGIP